ncbi:unnamed protein product [Rotaria sp. Silwood2]|nr:unnamed protein product [Rotaria sp. Silwood2]
MNPTTVVDPLAYSITLINSSVTDLSIYSITSSKSQGNDHVFVCERFNNDTIQLQRFINPGGYSSPILVTTNSDYGGIFQVTRVALNNGVVYCEFTLSNFTTTTGRRRKRSISLLSQNIQYYILTVIGNLDSSNSLIKHFSTAVLTQTIQLNQSATITSGTVAGSVINQILLLRAHGIIMLFIWMLFVPTGILIARYFRPSWPKRRLCATPVWFVIHQVVMVFAATMTLIAFTLILIFKRGTWVSQSLSREFAHSIMGLLVISTAIIQPVMAAVRCHPDHQRRFIFNHAHRIVGIGAWILSIATIFLGTLFIRFDSLMTKAWQIFVAWLSMQFVVWIGFECLEIFSRKRWPPFKIQNINEDIGELLHQDFVTQRDLGTLWNNDEDIFVYRGQAISRDILNQFDDNKGELVSFANFISTSRKRETAIFFAESTQALNQNLEPILFEMRLPARQPVKPFADVSIYSQFSDENEILFMIGTIFRIDEVIKKEEYEQGFTIVRLSLIGDNDYDLSEVVNDLKATRINTNLNHHLVSFASILEEMGEYDKAERYYRQLINQMPQDSYARAECLDGLGTIALRNGKYKEAIDHEIQAVQIYESHEPQDLLFIAKKYNNLGIAYGASGNYSKALLHFQRSNELKYCLFHTYQHVDMADTFDNIGNCYEFEGDFDQAEEHFHFALAIRITNNMPRRHPDFVKNYMSLGNVYGHKKMFKQAIFYHQKAVNLAHDVLPFDHPL